MVYIFYKWRMFLRAEWRMRWSNERIFLICCHQFYTRPISWELAWEWTWHEFCWKFWNICDMIPFFTRQDNIRMTTGVSRISQSCSIRMINDTFISFHDGVRLFWKSPRPLDGVKIAWKEIKIRNMNDFIGLNVYCLDIEKRLLLKNCASFNLTLFSELSEALNHIS